MRTFNSRYLQALADRDPVVENDLISTFTKPLHSKLRFCFSSPQVAEDALQETMLRLFTYFRSGKTLRNPESLPGFVHAVCAKVILEMIRTRRREGLNMQLLPVLIDHKADPEGETIAAERRESILRMLAELDDKDQELLWRVCLEEEDRSEICKRYHVTRNHLRLLLYRARVRFRALAVQNGHGSNSSPPSLS